MQKEKAKFASELAELYKDPMDVDQRAEEELAIYEEQCLKHQHRLMDNADTLQERLELLGFDWRAYYKTWKDFQPKEEERIWRDRAERSMPAVAPQLDDGSKFRDASVSFLICMYLTFTSFYIYS